MKVVKEIFNILISFLLIFIIILGFLFNFLSEKIFDKENMIKRLEETKFYTQISQEIYNGFEDYIYQSGLPEDTIKDLYTEDDIKNDINSILTYIYEGKEIKLSDEKVNENLDNKINLYLENENITLSKSEKENVNKFKKLIIDSYKSNVKVSNTLIEMSREYYSKINNIFMKVQDLPIIIGVILIFILFVINIKSLINALNYISISVLSSGILLKLFDYIFLKNVDIDNLLIIAKSLTSFIQNIMREFLYYFSNLSVYFIVFGITGIIIYAMIKCSLQTKSKIEKH